VKPVFVDTSAIYAVLVSEDARHAESLAILERLRRDRAALVSSSFVVQEAVALLQARVGLAAVRAFREIFLPVLQITWVDQAILDLAMAALLAAASRSISLTDWSSFEIMRARGIDTAFAIDPHFRRQGFQLLPGR
jgi:predicted nucleic acid-binding protein